MSQGTAESQFEELALSDINSMGYTHAIAPQSPFLAQTNWWWWGVWGEGGGKVSVVTNDF